MAVNFFFFKVNSSSINISNKEKWSVIEMHQQSKYVSIFLVLDSVSISLTSAKCMQLIILGQRSGEELRAWNQLSGFHIYIRWVSFRKLQKLAQTVSSGFSTDIGRLTTFRIAGFHSESESGTAWGHFFKCQFICRKPCVFFYFFPDKT